MSKKGISVVSLSVTVVVLIVLVSTISVSITYSISNAKKLTFAKEIYNIQNLVTEYIEKENTLPAVTKSIQISPSNTEQFQDETISEGKLILDVLDLYELGIKNSSYGNENIGGTTEEKSKDVYAISQNTGRVYYIAGFKDKKVTYYTLTQELLDMIDKKQSLAIGENSIVFIPSKIGWSTQGTSVKISVPKDYTVNSITIDNPNITYTTETINTIKYYNVNTKLINEEYKITVNYTKNGKTGVLNYATKLDTNAPSISKNTTISNTENSIRGLEAVDDKSGIKYFKYAEGVVGSANNIKEYIQTYGKNINKGMIKSDKSKNYTLYAEDKAGNYSVMYVGPDGKEITYNMRTVTGTNDFTLQNCVNINMLNYRIYGNTEKYTTGDEYEFVEYIESTGGQYIDTNIIPSSENFKIEYTVMYNNTNTVGEWQLSGAYDVDKRCQLGIKNTGEFIYGYGDTSLSTSVFANAQIKYTLMMEVKNNNLEGYLDNVKLGTTASTSTDFSTTLYLFNRNSSSSSYLGNASMVARMYGCKIYNDGVLVRDFIPCYRKADDVIGMYDVVGHKFYTNNGTGTFLKGNVVAIESEGNVVAIESVGDYDESTGKYKIPISVNNVITNIYLTEPLRKIGEYSDYIDFKTQKVVRRICSLDIGEATITYDNNYSRHRVTLNKPIIMAATRTVLMYSDVYNAVTDGRAVDAVEDKSVYNSEVETNVLFIKDLSFQDSVSLKANRTNCYIIYPLAVPEEERIDLPYLTLNYGTNRILIGTMLQPSKTEITYYINSN